MSSSSVPRALVSFAERLADAAGEVIRPCYRAFGTVEHKADDSPVTRADREAEAAMRDLIRAHYPDHGILGEEYGDDRADAEFVWCLDPIDGTKSFVIGRPLFGTLVSLLHAGRPVVGIIDQCILRERWIGIVGEASAWNGRPIRTRACTCLADAVLSVTSPMMFDAGERTVFSRLEETVRLPMYGGDCYAYGLLAMGFVDVIAEAGLDVHDFAALVPVIEGAGGIMTDWRGAALELGSGGRVLAAGDRRVHGEALELMAASDH